MFKRINRVLARALGFEPRSKVLETRMLPLHHARKNPLRPLPFDFAQDGELERV